MHKLKVFAAACLFACSFLLVSPTAFAATAWISTDGDVNISDIDFYGETTAIFGIYDWENSATVPDISNSLQLFNGTETGFTSFTFDVYQEDGQWKASFGEDVLDLSSNKFGFYFGDYQTDYIYILSDNSALLGWDDSIYLTFDAAPVPLPTAALLLGSGLVGLVGFRRKTKQ